MAYAFINITFPQYRSGACARQAAAYLGRTAFEGFDFTDVARDLVHSEVVLPDAAPAAFENPATLVSLIDLKELERMRQTVNRKRWPQIGAFVIVALPPDDEMTLDESLELLQRIVAHIIGTNALVAIVAVHDPRRTTPGARNRHAHVIVPLREVDRHGLGKKVRNLVARPRRNSKARRNYMAEGTHWPGLAYEMLQSFLAELGTDDVVDPPALVGERHWPPSVVRNDPDRIETHRRVVRKQNIEKIHGPAGVLVDRMLRGRGAMPVKELERLLERFINGADERRDCLERILVDGAIVTLASSADQKRPARLTTRAIYDLVLKATALVDRARAQRDPPVNSVPTRLIVVSGAGADTVTQNIGILVRARLQGMRRRRPLLLGVRKSDCDALAADLATSRPIVTTIQATLKVSASGPGRPRKLKGIKRNGLVVVGRSESIDDQSLARLLIAADAQHATVVLGYDENRRAGIAGQRLAAYAADALAPRKQPAEDLRWIERHLRAGRVDRAIAAMNELGVLEFTAVDDPGRGDVEGFLVCDDPKRLNLMNDALRVDRDRHSGFKAPVAIDLPHQSFKLAPLQWIAVTETDYAKLPPTIRAGQLAQVTQLFPDRQTIQIRIADGNAEDIDLGRHPHIRSAFAISIREARRAPPANKLMIEVTQSQRAWAALLLAASRDGNASVRIDPAVATDAKSLAHVIRATLPAASPADLVLRTDPEAEAAAIFRAFNTIIMVPETRPLKAEPEVHEEFDHMPEPQATGKAPHAAQAERVSTPPLTMVPENHPGIASEFAGPADSVIPARASTSHTTGPGEPAPAEETDYFERFPKPQQPPPADDAIPEQLHIALRDIFKSGPDPELALHRLRAAVAPDVPDREQIGASLLNLCVPGGPTAVLIQLLMKPLSIKRPQKKPLYEALDLPDELTSHMPRSWSPLDLSCFKTDLRTMASKYSVWNRQFSRTTPAPWQHEENETTRGPRRP